MGSDGSHFNVSVGSGGQSHKTVSTNHNFFWRERRAAAVSNRGPSAYQPNALPQGQTGSQVLRPVNHYGYIRAMRTVKDHRLFEEKLDSCIKTHHNEHTAKRRQDNVEWAGVIGLLIWAIISSNFESEPSSRGVQSVPSCWRLSLCIVGKTRVFPYKPM